MYADGLEHVNMVVAFENSLNKESDLPRCRGPFRESI